MRLLVLLLFLTTAAWPQAFSPQSETAGNLPVQPLGPNDLIAVSVYGSPEFTRTARVSEDGYIRLPLLKQRIHAEGLLPAELENAIAEALKSESLLVEPFVTVNIAEY